MKLTALFTALFLSTSLTLFSQSPSRTLDAVDPRWSLILQRTKGGSIDSLVQGPYSDFVRMYAARVTANQLKRELAWEFMAQEQVLQSVMKERDAALRKAAVSEERAKVFRDEKDAREQELMKCALKRERLKTWATVGKIAVFGTLAVGAVYLIVP